jgi:archaellum component FlaG (FlaF/FlaG flagellin family)
MSRNIYISIAVSRICSSSILVRALIFYPRALIIYLLTWSAVLSFRAEAQRATNSVLSNFGRVSCDSTLWGSDMTLVQDPQGASPDFFLQCATTGTFDNVISKFISYNSTKNQLYINDISDYTNSRIHVLDIGLPSNCYCPDLDTPDYTIENVILSQFEFDADGDLYALSNYDPYFGTATIGAYDDTTGQLVTGSDKTLYFPMDHLPSDVANGDLVIIPNGRMFCVFGYDTSKVFEITNYSKEETGDAIANFIGSPTSVCFAIAFENGHLVMGGTDLYGYCYSFDYDIANSTLGNESGSPLNIMPIDYTSFSPSVAVGMKLIGSTQVDATHYDLTYHIYIKNLGNVRVGNVSVKDDLAAVFGSENISNVSLSFVSNGGGLELNGSYDGDNNISILRTGLPFQSLGNYPSDTSSSLIELNVTVANPVYDSIYYNSAIFSGKIGRDSTLLTVEDSSNNYSVFFSSWPETIDPNFNNVADDPGEGVPTPWVVSQILPVELSHFTVQPDNGNVVLDWTTEAEQDIRYFVVERSLDAIKFDSLGSVAGAGTTLLSSHYSFSDVSPPHRTLYYRLRIVNSKGTYGVSEVKAVDVSTQEEAAAITTKIYPNPIKDYLIIERSGSVTEQVYIEVKNVLGETVLDHQYPGTVLREKLSLPSVSSGHYYLKVTSNSGTTEVIKIFVKR